MKISIFKKLELFSKKTKTCFLLPGTSFQITLYPTRIDLKDLEGDREHYLAFSFGGAVQDFLAKLDLEKEEISFSGKSPKGFFRFVLKKEEEGIVLHYKKGPEVVLDTDLSIGKSLSPKQSAVILSNVNSREFSNEKLSFGSHKDLDVSKIDLRNSLSEIVPIWFYLSQKIVCQKPTHRQGCAKFLDFPEEKKALEKHLEDFFKAGFVDFCPRLTDEYQGFLDSKGLIEDGNSSMVLLKELGVYIRELFFRQEGSEFYLLEKLLQPFHCGRFINIDCMDLGTMDFEWSKKRIKKVLFYPKKSGQIVLYPQKGIKSFRVRSSMRSKGEIVGPGDVIEIVEGSALFIDRFEK